MYYSLKIICYKLLTIQDMPLFDFFRNILNIPSKNEDLSGKQNNSDIPHERQDYRNHFWGPNSNSYDEMWSNAHENRGRNDDNIRNFNVFTDPLEMHRYFEHQMDEMLKSFGGFFGSDNFFGFNAQIPSLAPPESQFPSVEQPPENDNLRARLLKPGYENRDYSKRDQVIDDRVIHAGDLDELLKEKGPTYRNGVDEDGVVSPYQRKPILPQIRSFGQSMSSKTIRRPDGTTEVHKTVRDSAGNEETVVTRQMGDKQYTVTVRTDKEGRQETCEEFINMDEQELPKFKDYWNQGNLPQNDGTNNTVDDINKLFPFFDKFFK